MTDLGTLGGVSTSDALGVNSSGQVVGTLSVLQADSTVLVRAFLVDPVDSDANDLMQDLGTIGGQHSLARAINDSGQVAGWALNSGGERHAALWQLDSQGGVVSSTDLGVVKRKHTESRAFDLNNSAQVVGYSIDASPKALRRLQLDDTAFVWEAGQMKNISRLLENNGGFNDLTRAAGINDAGEIAGQGAINGAYNAYVALPNNASSGSASTAGTPGAPLATATALSEGGGSLAFDVLDSVRFAASRTGILSLQAMGPVEIVPELLRVQRKESVADARSSLAAEHSALLQTHPRDGDRNYESVDAAIEQVFGAELLEQHLSTPRSGMLGN